MVQPTPEVWGLDLDPQTRCRHYHGPSDIVAIRMKCCGKYYACKDCHIALAGHPLELWPESEWGQEAVRCGVCQATLTIRQYVQGKSCCTYCGAQFNPGCRNHFHLYFETPASGFQDLPRFTSGSRMN